MFLHLSRPITSKSSYVAGYSVVVHSLIDITDTIKESIDSGKFGGVVFIDLEKVFESESVTFGGAV